MTKLFETLGAMWTNLSDREQRLVTAMGFVFLGLVVMLTVYLTSSALADVETERDELRAVLADIDLAAPELARRKAERAQAEARFRTPVPGLASFIEGKATDEGLDVRQVTEQPGKEIGRYARQHVRVQFSGVSLRPTMRLLAAIESSHLPIAVERIQLEHYQSGDSYNVQVGVIAFERKAGGGSEADEKGTPGDEAKE